MGRSVRLAVTGAQGVGKSTFARSLCRLCREQLDVEAELFTNITGEVRATGVRLGRGATAETIREFAEAHLRRQRAAGATVSIFDRCILDTLAYAEVAGCLDPADFAELESNTAASMSAMHVVFYLGISEDYPALTNMDEDLATRARIDAAIRRAAAALRIPLVKLDAADPLHPHAGLRVVAEALGRSVIDGGL